MTVDMKEYLSTFIAEQLHQSPSEWVLPDVVVNPDSVHVMMINEVSPKDPADDFYGRGNRMPAYMADARMLFERAELPIETAADALDMGIYLTNAVKIPKSESRIETQTVLAHVPVLEAELEVFPNLRAVMLMGDVAKKAFNAIVKSRTKKNALPSGSTYKLRTEAFYYGSIRVFPSYIMTGSNLRIEPSKTMMIADDLKRMKAFL